MKSRDSSNKIQIVYTGDNPVQVADACKAIFASNFKGDGSLDIETSYGDFNIKRGEVVTTDGKSIVIN